MDKNSKLEFDQIFFDEDEYSSIKSKINRFISYPPQDIILVSYIERAKVSKKALREENIKRRREQKREEASEKIEQEIKNISENGQIRSIINDIKSISSRRRKKGSFGLQ